SSPLASVSSNRSFCFVAAAPGANDYRELKDPPSRSIRSKLCAEPQDDLRCTPAFLFVKMNSQCLRIDFGAACLGIEWSRRRDIGERRDGDHLVLADQHASPVAAHTKSRRLVDVHFAGRCAVTEVMQVGIH